MVAQYLQSVTGTPSRRVWPDLESAPGGKYARLREVRVVDEHGELLDSVDIRRPVGIEMTFTVLRDDVPMFPKIKLYDREGDAAFNALDTSSEWEELAGTGDYTSTAWIPAELPQRGLLPGRRRRVQPGPGRDEQADPPDGRARGRLLQRLRPGRGGFVEGQVPWAPARARAAAARLDD